MPCSRVTSLLPCLLGALSCGSGPSAEPDAAPPDSGSLLTDAGHEICTSSELPSSDVVIRPIAGASEYCVQGRFEGRLASVTPTGGDGLTLRIEIGTELEPDLATCDIEISSVGGVAAQQVAAGMQVVGELGEDEDTDQRWVWLAEDAPLAPCEGELMPRRPLVFFYGSGLAGVTEPRAPGVSTAIAPGFVCQTPPSSDECGFCSPDATSCWYSRSHLEVWSARGCDPLEPVAVPVGETVPLHDDRLSARLVGGLWTRECDTSWLPEPGRGVWVFWRSASVAEGLSPEAP